MRVPKRPEAALFEPLSSLEMNLKDRQTEHETLTRRVVLTGGLGCALTLLIPQRVLRAENREGQSNPTPQSISHDAELYVFRGAGGNRTVLAATWNALPDNGSTVHVHAGEKCWSIPMPHGNSIFTQERGSQIFAGDILNRLAGRQPPLKAVVIEAPTDEIFASGPTPVWAERISTHGRRLRIGSPFMAKLIVGNEPASELYHASSPTQDGEELTRLVAEAISVKAEAHGYAGNAQLYGRRVASAILPDALRFDPTLPVGFTFAAQNGRHPDDAAQSIVETVLRGAVTPPPAQSRFPLTSDFPYFVQPFTQA
jgi:hypothetical protein